MKLLDILLEVLRESKPITLDKSVYPQMEKVYDNFKKLENDENTKRYFEYGGIGVTLGRITFNNTYDPSFKGVDVDLHFDHNKNIRGSYNTSTSTVYINFNSNVGETKFGFLKTLYHELVHAIDPKLNNYKISNSFFKNLDKKYDRDKSSGEYSKYLKNPAEFDAFSSTYINQIKDGLELLPDADKQKVKAALKVLINTLLGLLKKYPNGNYGDFEVSSMGFNDLLENNIDQLLTINKLIFEGSTSMTEEFFSNVIRYLNKPSLFKKYIQRLSTVL
jgi:hypothetical protein